MEVILLERVAKLGQIGDVVRVKDGYARNFLLPKGKALRATQENKTRFESMKSQLEARNLELRSEAEKVARKLDGIDLGEFPKRLLDARAHHLVRDRVAHDGETRSEVQ